MKFFEEKYTKGCVVNRATTYPKFRLGSLPLIVHLCKILKNNALNYTSFFFKFHLFLIKNGFQEISEIDNSVEKTIFYYLRRSTPETLKW